MNHLENVRIINGSLYSSNLSDFQMHRGNPELATSKVHVTNQNLQNAMSRLASPHGLPKLPMTHSSLCNTYVYPAVDPVGGQKLALKLTLTGILTLTLALIMHTTVQSNTRLDRDSFNPTGFQRSTIYLFTFTFNHNKSSNFNRLTNLGTTATCQ